MDNSEKIISKIKEENIQPIPKWKIRWSRFSTWTLYFLFILSGAISFSVIIYSIQQSEFSMLKHIGHSKIELILVLLPLLWLILLISFLIVSVISARQTKKAYKWSFGKWIGLSLLLSLAIGTLFFISGGAQWVEKSFANQIEIYNSVNERKMKIWMDPVNGRIAGEIQQVNENEIILIDFDGKKWLIDISGSYIAQRVLLETGEKIKMFGEQAKDNSFIANDIKPWGNINQNKNHKRNEKGGKK